MISDYEYLDQNARLVPFDNLVPLVPFDNVDIFIHAMEIPLKEIPLYVNSPLLMIRDIIKWRVELGR